MVYIMEESGQRIAELRAQSGYSQNELADVLNISRSFLSKVESGNKGCSVDLFVQLSAFFGVSLDYLIVGRRNEADQGRLKKNVDELIEWLEAFREIL